MKSSKKSNVRIEALRARLGDRGRNSPNRLGYRFTVEYL